MLSFFDYESYCIYFTCYHFSCLTGNDYSSMTNNPIERLRNKLTPFFTVVDILSSPDVIVKTQKNGLLKILFDALAVCNENKGEINLYLSDAETIIERSGFQTKQGLDYNELRIKFDEHMSKVTKEDMEEWLEMDRKRMNDAESGRDSK